MRVSAETKAASRKKILETAQRLFAENGFEATTTRDIAQAAGIAAGTLFNYFPTKESLVGSLASEASSAALSQFDTGSQAANSLEEDLFSLVAAGMRKLKPLRKHLPSLLETSLSPLASSAAGESQSLRTEHLEAVVKLAGRHRHQELSPVALQLYWTLYTGILVYWASDKSPRQEDTLALIDHSLNMFAGWLRDHAGS